MQQLRKFVRSDQCTKQDLLPAIQTHTHTHLNNLLVAKELATSLAPMPQEAPNAAMDPKTMSQAYAFLRM